ncbi:hypothetical protein [Arcobacter vandammei]|uniref:hypothetical protein n=1 Tax=Arcobacter vandammei TaxID=2782243 RepID=UPI0018DF3F68|nr:hypothetical protein [Arcobacter vandammei]
MNIKLDGGSTDLHMIALSDMKKLAESIQKISYNYEYERYGTRNREIYIQANKEGSFEIVLGLIDIVNYQTILEGLAGAFLYDLIKKMKSYTQSKEFVEDIKKLIDTTFEIATELAEEEYFNSQFVNKKQTIESNLKKINAEFSNYNAMKQISSIIAQNEEKSLKPTSIKMIAKNDIELEEVLEINISNKHIFDSNELDNIKIDNIIISGVPDGLTRSSKFFYIDVDFIGKMKIRATDKQLSKMSDYFKNSQAVKIEVEPIIKIGELIETRDARLIKIIEE